jgi:hypothetical protein
MPIGMQTLFAGDHFWKMPKDLQMEVGPTIPIPLPLKYREDTERYRLHVKLKASQDGGYTLDGYVAGVPFPNPERDPMLVPYKIFYYAYYRYTPRLQRAYTCNYALDSYGNFTLTETVDAVYSQLAHLSDVGFPQTVPNAGDYFLVKYLQLPLNRVNIRPRWTSLTSTSRSLTTYMVICPRHGDNCGFRIRRVALPSGGH